MPGGDRTEAGWSFDASVYHNALRDYIERYRVAGDLRSYRNLDRADISGFELNLAWRPDGPWAHALGYQWQRGEDEEGNILADLNPPGVHYRLTWQGERWQMRSALHYRASRDDAGPGELPLASALTWNASAARQLGPGWRLEFYAVNLLDEHYRGAADEDAAYQPGRTLGVRLAWQAF